MDRVSGEREWDAKVVMVADGEDDLREHEKLQKHVLENQEMMKREMVQLC